MKNSPRGVANARTRPAQGHSAHGPAQGSRSRSLLRVTRNSGAQAKAPGAQGIFGFWTLTLFHRATKNQNPKIQETLHKSGPGWMFMGFW